jgi:hypothetical protein
MAVGAGVETDVGSGLAVGVGAGVDVDVGGGATSAGVAPAGEVVAGPGVPRSDEVQMGGHSGDGRVAAAGLAGAGQVLRTARVPTHWAPATIATTASRNFVVAAMSSLPEVALRASSAVAGHVKSCCRHPVS